MNNSAISERLMSLYGGCGYTRYRVNKFEEYELYSRNREFLPSKQILTFTDTDGRLMALKPDVTLSIVRNSRDGEDARLFYSESVFRTDRGRGVFAEVPQIGLEYIGRADPYRVSEVLTLAGMSLDLISEENVLDVSHPGILSLTAARLGLDFAGRAALTGCFGSKSAGGALSLCGDRESEELVKALLGMSSDPDKALPLLGSLSDGAEWDAVVYELRRAVTAVPDRDLRIDLSVVNDADYYNGVVFRGYVKGSPSAVLSGGQYDNLMKKNGKNNSAAGFAVYLDRIDAADEGDAPALDLLILYDDMTDPAAVCRRLREAASAGLRVSAERELPDGQEYSAICDMRKKHG